MTGMAAKQAAAGCHTGFSKRENLLCTEKETPINMRERGISS